MTTYDFAVSGTFTVPAGVTSLWLQVWGAYGGFEGVYFEGGYADGEYACTPGEVVTATLGQSAETNGEESVWSELWVPIKGTLIYANSGYNNDIEGGYGYGYLTGWVTNGSAAYGVNPDFAKARITYAGGGPAPFVGWGVPL